MTFNKKFLKMTILTLKFIAQFSMCYYIGITLYTKIDSGHLGVYLKNKLYIIQNLSLIKLTLIIFSIYMILYILTQFCTIMILDSYLISNTEHSQLILNILGNETETSISESTKNNNISSSTNTSAQIRNSSVETDSANEKNTIYTSNTSRIQQFKDSSLQYSYKDYAGKARDILIMVTALASASKVAQHVPSIAGNTSTLAGVLSLGSIAIVAINFSGNVTKNLGKGNSYIPFESTINEMLNLTGNDFLDLLKLIKAFQDLALFFSLLSLYYFILYNINIDKIENLLLRIFPKYLVMYCIKNLNYLKKFGFVLIICFLILTICATFLSIHYLDFIIENYDEIIDYYKNNK